MELFKQMDYLENLKIGNTKDTLHYRYYDGIGVILTPLEIMELQE